MEGQWGLVRCSFNSTRNLISWNTRTNLWQNLFTNFSFAPVKDCKESAFSTKNVSDQVLLTTMAQTYLKKGGDARYWSREKKHLQLYLSARCRAPWDAPATPDFKDEPGTSGTAKRESETTRFKHKDPCHSLTGLLARLEKPFYQLTESILSTAERSSWAFQS